MLLPTYRLTAFIIFAVSLASIIAALIMQHRFEMEPCPLCITQRLFVIGAGAMAFIAFLHNPLLLIFKRVYALAGLLLSLVGGGVSARHVWLQSLPEDQAPACGPGLEYMFDTFPLMEALTLLFKGDGNCADVVWSFLGLSIPGWTFVLFSLFSLGFIMQMTRKET